MTLYKPPLQVLKTAWTGQFDVRGKKHYLPPSALEMGFGLIFRLDEGSVERHRYSRDWCCYDVVMTLL